MMRSHFMADPMGLEIHSSTGAGLFVPLVKRLYKEMLKSSCVKHSWLTFDLN
jgi:hypothetical protein